MLDEDLRPLEDLGFGNDPAVVGIVAATLRWVAYEMMDDHVERSLNEDVHPQVHEVICEEFGWVNALEVTANRIDPPVGAGEGSTTDS